MYVHVPNSLRQLSTQVLYMVEYKESRLIDHQGRRLAFIIPIYNCLSYPQVCTIYLIQLYSRIRRHLRYMGKVHRYVCMERSRGYGCVRVCRVLYVEVERALM